MAYADSSHADNVTTRESSSDQVLMLNGGPVVWKSDRLPLVTLSSTESEYCTLSLGAKEVVATSRLLVELEYSDDGDAATPPVTIYENS